VTRAQSREGEGGELPRPGEVIAGRYRVEHVLGEGGMGVVVAATQLQLDRQVAIKLRTGASTSDSLRERFVREARAAARLRSEHAVRVLDFGTTEDGAEFLVMERLEGEDLAAVVARGPLPLGDVVHFVLQACEALAEAHQAGIVHRDIKPANIMLTCQGEVKITDFGLAKDVARVASMVTETHMVMGTPEYAAPEQFNAHREVDHRADIYALGVLMYQMLTGALPRGSWQPPSVLRPGLDPRLDAVVIRALMQDRQHRFQSVGDMRRAIESALVPAVQTPSRPLAQPAGRAGRILLLEDDLMVRDLMRRALEKAAFEVVETGDGKDTLRLYQEAMQQGRPFDLAILDLTIPDGMCGRETMLHLRRIDPRILAIVSSGYRDDPVMKDCAAYGFAAALPKPYQVEGLLQMVNGALAVGRRGMA
jgi:serine/threonine-protein kinase